MYGIESPIIVQQSPWKTPKGSKRNAPSGYRGRHPADPLPLWSGAINVHVAAADLVGSALRRGASGASGALSGFFPFLYKCK
jgi:hypothetical protein